MKFLYLTSTLLILINCKTPDKSNNSGTTAEVSGFEQDYSAYDTATFAGGCFWCVEASFDQIKGIAEAVSGYAGGTKENANYKLVSAGKTEHAETVQIYYDPNVIDYETLLDIFFTAHDPTQINRQGPDVGYQYRTAIFYHNEKQKALAEAKIEEIRPKYENPIATELNEYTDFYLAEEYHQDYEEKHPFDPYIMNVSRPKINKVKKEFMELLKEED